MDGLDIRVEAPVVRAVIDVGDGENRLTPEMLDHLGSILASPPDGVHVFHLSATGPAFCLGPRPPAGGLAPREMLGMLVGFNRALRSSNLVTVTEVDGLAAGFGVGVACLADLTFAGESASFQLPEVTNDVIPALVLSWLTDVVGAKTAVAMALTARPLGAEEAAASGLVTRAFPSSELRDGVDEVISTLAGLSAATLSEIKRYLADRPGRPIGEAEDLAVERMVAWTERASAR